MSRVYEGSVIVQSLEDVSVLSQLSIIKTSTMEDWIIHTVRVSEESIPLLQQALADGPWYIHVWDKESGTLVIIYKEKIFPVALYDRSTWGEAIRHGESIGIPTEQLDFIAE